MKQYSFKEDPRITTWQRELLREFCSGLDGNVVELAGKFGLKVFEEEDLLPYERGYLENAPSLGSETGWVIRINKNDKPQVKNFTIAHELGHFTLHSVHLQGLDQFDGVMQRNTEKGVDPFYYLDKRDQDREAEANRFAALVLMPPNLFKPAFDRLRGDVQRLAELFFVSEPAVERRTKELRLSAL